jgi:hypothetical protein
MNYGFAAVRGHFKTSKHGKPFYVKAFGRQYPLTREEAEKIKVVYKNGGYRFQVGDWFKKKVVEGEFQRPEHIDEPAWVRFKSWMRRNEGEIIEIGLIAGFFEYFIPGHIVILGGAAGLFGMLPVLLARKLGWHKTEEKEGIEQKAKEIKASLETEVLRTKGVLPSAKFPRSA